jgi:hypothetical protein
MFGPPGWGLDARLTTLRCKIITLEKSKEVKTGSNLEEFPKEDYVSKSAVFSMMMMN